MASASGRLLLPAMGPSWAKPPAPSLSQVAELVAKRSFAISPRSGRPAGAVYLTRRHRTVNEPFGRGRALHWPTGRSFASPEALLLGRASGNKSRATDASQARTTRS